ncbi:hypothetical protein RRG08_037075 [Elysia crispata]|uniref:Uncharacterized protein n=1 Tax=Elysia crispata TaxID=231223 RepID=A0AAE0ZW28_9GAST|nr:hypothetical protein RRG08_037075 [Elysia crispata]
MAMKFCSRSQENLYLLGERLPLTDKIYRNLRGKSRNHGNEGMRSIATMPNQQMGGEVENGLLGKVEMGVR